MARYWFRLFGLIAIMLGIVAAIGSVLPRSYDFQSQIVIDASAQKIFPLVNKISNWQSWSQWDPHRLENLTVQYSGSEAGQGSIQTWTDQRGEGKLWITDSRPDDRIDFQLLFQGFPEMANSIELKPVTGSSEPNDATEVTWSSAGKLPGGPFYGYFSPFFATGMRAQYDESLQRLKKQAEADQE